MPGRKHYRRAVAHIDANYFYGQIEALFRPEVRGRAFVVGGDQESRKGIVLTKSPPAKKMGVKTGSSIKEALNVCPDLTILPANYPLYQYFSERMREIVLQHTDTIRPFGSDEMWCQLYGERGEVMDTVEKIRKAIWRELCLTVSVGVGDNLPYAKIGSDLATEDSVCELWDEDREKLVYPLPVGDLLYVGPKTKEKFKRVGINTIGDLANTSPETVCRILRNRTGETLWSMANGFDKTTVESIEGTDGIKSIGNSNTMPRDLLCDDDVKAAFYMLGESVSRRMRECGFEAKTLEIYIRDNDLYSCSRQAKLRRPTNLTADFVPQAMELFRRSYKWTKPIRSLGIRGTELVPEGAVYQLGLFENIFEYQKLDRLERMVDMLRGRFGKTIVQRAVLLRKRMKSVNSNNDMGDAPIFYRYG